MNSSYISTLPSVVLLQNILPFLSVKEAIRFDSAIADKSYREEVCKQITIYVNNILSKDYIGFDKLEWLVKRNAIITSLKFIVKVATAELSLMLARSLTMCNETLVDLSFDIRDKMDLVATCPSLPNLERFTIFSSLIPQRSTNFWPLHPTLTHVVHHGCFDRGSDDIFKLAYNCHELISLEFYSTVNDRDIDALATHCPLLERVSVGPVMGVFPTGSLTTVTLVKLASNCKGLKELNLRTIEYLTDDAVAALVPHIPYIQHLCLRGWSKITDTSISYIIDHCHNLQSIDLTKCSLVTKSGYLQLKLIPTLTAITMLDSDGKTRHIINPHTDEIGFAKLLEVVEEANREQCIIG